MKIILTERQLHNIISEQAAISKYQIPKETGEIVVDMLDFIERTRDKIESYAKNVFNQSTPWGQRIEPNIIKDMEDAFCHQTMSAIIMAKYGKTISWVIGWMNEIKGGLRIFLKGSKKIPRFTKMSSGYTTDMKNNEIGREMVNRYPGKNVDGYMKLIEKNVKAYNFYDRYGKYMR
jgi:hypothetical protein